LSASIARRGRADARLDLTALDIVTNAPRKRQVDEEQRRSEPAREVEPLARFERATYGLRRRIHAR
jgi:hypothetical protein